MFFLLTALLVAAVAVQTDAAIQWEPPVVLYPETVPHQGVVPGGVCWYQGKLAISFTSFRPEETVPWKPGLILFDLRNGHISSYQAPLEGHPHWFSAPAVLSDGLYLAWLRKMGQLPDGFDRWQLVAAKLENDTLSAPVLIADSLWEDAGLACGFRRLYAVETLSYYGARAQETSYLFVFRGGDQIERHKLPKGEWEQPSVWVVDSLEVHVVGWQGYAIHYAYTTDGGKSWHYPSIPPRHGHVQNMRIMVAPNRRRFLVWNEDLGGNIFPDVLYASSSPDDSSWSPPKALFTLDRGYDKWPVPDGLAFINLRRAGYAALAIWVADIWDTPETYVSLWWNGAWQAPERVFADWPPEGFVSNCRIFADGTGRVHLVGTLPTPDSGSVLIYTRTTSRVTAVKQEGLDTVRIRFEAPELKVQPTPFNAATNLIYRIPQRTSGKATLNVFDIAGRIVRRLRVEAGSPGPHTIRWNGTDNSGHPLPSGVYIVRLQAGGQVATRKVVLVR